MPLVDVAKQFLQRYYPQKHLRIAAGLAVLTVVLLLLPEPDGSAVTDQARLTIPVATGSQREEPEVNAPAADISDAGIKGIAAVDSGTAVPGDPQVRADTAMPSDTATWQNVIVRSGDNLSAIFKQVGLSDQDMFRVLNSSEEAAVLNRLFPGYQLDFMMPTAGELSQLRVLKSPLEGFMFTRNDQGYAVEPIVKVADLAEAFRVGTVSDSLFMAGQKENIPAEHIMEMANIFGGVIDFILDPRQGDQFSILYEEQYLDGEYIGHGDILATQYINDGEVFTAIRYINEEGEAGYYSPEGESMRKAFLRSPLDVFRISSNFNPRRRHPILNTIRAHKGTDYAAPTGTPVRATSDGRVTWAARNGSFGNLVVVKHEGGFETKYAHLSRYAVRKGERVRQGEVIAYVGATGGATGPHLHYEFLMNGVHQNPRTILDRLPKAVSIEPEEMDRFRSQTARLLDHFQNLNSNQLFSLNQPSAD